MIGLLSDGGVHSRYDQLEVCGSHINSCEHMSCESGKGMFLENQLVFLIMQEIIFGIMKDGIYWKIKVYKCMCVVCMYVYVYVCTYTYFVHLQRIPMGT